MATIDVKKHLTDERIKAIFRQFDADNSGKITPSDIVAAMKKMGEEIKESEVRQMMSDHKFTQSEGLNLQEFKKIILEL